MSKHHTHLTSSERILIEQGLNEHLSLRKIAMLVDKLPTTIQREIIERSVENLKGAAHRITNRCIHKTQCVHQKRSISPSKYSTSKKEGY